MTLFQGKFAPHAIAGRMGRCLAIVAIFGTVGPLAVAAFVSLVALALGAPLFERMLAAADLEALRTAMSLAAWLLAIVAVMAAFPPFVATGLIFAIAAIYSGLRAIWAAWLAALLAVAVFVGLSVTLTPSETSALLLPGFESIRQGVALTLMLAIPALMAASLCWWLARPLHRARIAG